MGRTQVESRVETLPYSRYADPAVAARAVPRARVPVGGHALEAVLLLAGESHGQLRGEAVGLRRDFTE
jgi:hypothetical protein